MARPENAPHIIETTSHHHGSEYSTEKIPTRITERVHVETHLEKQHNVEQARIEALKEAAEGHGAKNDVEQRDIEDYDNHTFSSQEGSFEHTMNGVRTDLPTPEQAFSRFIHNPMVEKTSDFVGSTILRPNAVLSGSICALILVGLLYWLARYYGFALQGFETIGAFMIGWVIGIIFDAIRSLIAKRY